MDDDLSRAGAAAAPAQISIDPIMPPAMAVRAEEAGAKRAATDPITLLTLSVLGGAFVSFGAVFATTVTAGSIDVTATDGATAMAATLPYGLVRLLSGIVFSLALILIIVGGAELFTGNTMIVMAWASGKVKTGVLLSNWGLVFAGNVTGTVLTAGLMFLTTQYTFGNGAVGWVALSTAHAKTSLGFVPALALGIMCNVLVCLAVWMCYGARTTIDRVVTIVPPIAGFSAAGFEHSIANAYFIPLGLLIKGYAPASFWQAIGKTPADFPHLTWQNFILGNLLPVTIGNIIGGAVLVAAVYWFIYLRKPLRPPAVR